MSSSNIGQLPSHTDTSIKEFMSNHPETITMETEAPVSYKPMFCETHVSQNSGGNDFQNLHDLACFIERDTQRDMAKRYALPRV